MTSEGHSWSDSSTGDTGIIKKDYRGESYANTVVTAVLLVIGIIYTILHQAGFDLLSLPELLWNILVYVTPASLLAVLDKKPMATDILDLPRSQASKSESMRRILGLDGGNSIMGNVAQAGRRRLSSLSGISLTAHGDAVAPPGLGNWDNSCYQNSVLQGLASLDTLPKYLKSSTRSTTTGGEAGQHGCTKMADSLQTLLEQLNDPSNNGKRIWTPAALKSMSSWQQQDAQEYFSKVLDEVDKEISNSAKAAISQPDFQSRPWSAGSIGSDVGSTQTMTPVGPSSLRNPLDGLLAQRVGCTVCGFSEGLSMIPFNCLTVPLGKAPIYQLSDCLEEYTKLEAIEGVECGKCTLLKLQRLLNVLLERTKDTENNGGRENTLTRLETITTALEEDDYDEKTLGQKCKIPSKNRVTTTKSRQAVIARPPHSLVVHINRSLFDERTGELQKNHAGVEFPKRLDLGPWCLGSFGTDNDDQHEEWVLNPLESMISGVKVTSRTEGPIYELRAVVTHYGRHENGHYISYRKHAPHQGSKEWWRLSDDDVCKVSEDSVLHQGGVFMLFYDCVEPGRVRMSPTKTTSVATETYTAGKEITAVPGDVLSQAEPTANDVRNTIVDKTDSTTLSLLPSLNCESTDITNDTESSVSPSVATSISEDDDLAGPEPQYAPAKAILIPPYLPLSGRQYGSDDEGKAIQPREGSSMVMV